MSKYVKLTSLDCNNNWFNYSRKINKYGFKLIRNKEKQFIKHLRFSTKKRLQNLDNLCFIWKKSLFRRFKVKYDLTLIIVLKDI